MHPVEASPPCRKRSLFGNLLRSRSPHPLPSWNLALHAIVWHWSTSNLNFKLVRSFSFPRGESKGREQRERDKRTKGIAVQLRGKKYCSITVIIISMLNLPCDSNDRKEKIRYISNYFELCIIFFHLAISMSLNRRPEER